MEYPRLLKSNIPLGLNTYQQRIQASLTSNDYFVVYLFDV